MPEENLSVAKFPYLGINSTAAHAAYGSPTADPGNKKTTEISMIELLATITRLSSRSYGLHTEATMTIPQHLLSLIS